MRSQARTLIVWASCWISCGGLEGCALLRNEASQKGTLQQVGDQSYNAPVVPAVATDSAPAIKAASSASPSTAHLTAGLRSGNNESNLTIVDQATQIDTHAAKPEQRVPTVRQATWNGDRLTWEQARDRLQRAGVTWLQLELRTGVWRLQCSIPNPQDPQKARFFESQATDELSAMRAVLEKLNAVDK